MPTIAQALQLSVAQQVNDCQSFDKAVTLFREMKDNERSLFKIDRVVAEDQHCYVSCADLSVLYFSAKQSAAYQKAQSLTITASLQNAPTNDSAR